VSLIYIAPVDDVGEEILAAIEMCLWHTFGFETKRWPGLVPPPAAYDQQRQQHSSTLILREALAQCPADAVRLLVVTEKDLFIPMLSFVFGQAQLQGRVAIVSMARLRQEFYELPANPVLLLARALKETVHEMGHTFGLTHCLDRSCPMSLSTNIQQVDVKQDEFCPSCTILLQETLNMLHQQATNASGAGGSR